MDRFERRRDRVRRATAKQGADALLVTDPINVFYLTGFTGGDSYLFLRSEGETILSDPRYTTQLEEECPGMDLQIRRPGQKMLEVTAKTVKKAKIGRLGFEADSMTVALRDRLAEKLPKTELVSTSGLVEGLRQTKDKEEIAQIRQAVWHAEKAFGAVRATLRPEQTERQLVNELEYRMRQFGARAAGFPSIVGVGARAALPHATATDQRIAESGFVLIDWGANSGLYNSDLTRVLLTGKISPKLERIYRVVFDAQARAIEAVRPGAKTCDVDRAAREHIAEAGFGRYFGHGLGHGLGLEVHEEPRLSVESEAVLKAGMVITIEPGIYLPGFGGVRIEDDVLVTRGGHEVLTSVPKEWESMFVP